MKKSNVWHEAVIAHLGAAGGPLTVRQIWERMEAAGFKHGSKAPQATLGGRIAELRRERKIERVGPATYRLAAAQPSEVSP